MYATLVLGDTVTTGELVTSCRADAATSVRSFATDGTSLLVGGALRMLAGAPRTYTGKVSLVTVPLIPVDAGFTADANSSVQALEPSPAGDRLYVGGNVSALSGVRHT